MIGPWVRSVDAEEDWDAFERECGWCAAFVEEGEEFCSPACAEASARFDADHATDDKTQAVVPATEVVAVTPRALDADDRLLRRVAIGSLVALAAAPVVTAGVLFLSGHWGAEPQAPIWRVVDSQCLNGRVQQGIDTGRADGLLLAHDTGEAC